MDKATLPHLNEPKHDYVGLPVTEMNAEPVGLWILTLRRGLPISRPAKFQASKFNNKKKYIKLLSSNLFLMF